MKITGTADSYTIEMDGQELAALARFGSTDTARTNLFGLAIFRSADAIQLMTSDGHRLCISETASMLGLANPILIVCDLRKLVKIAGKFGSLQIEVAGAKAIICARDRSGSLNTQHPKIGTPEPMDSAVPTGAPTAIASISLNAKYVADLALLSAAAGLKTPAVTLTFHGEGAPFVCTVAAGDADETQWSALIMPMRL